MSEDARILAITKRTGDLCATQCFLHRAGLGLAAATNLNAAHTVIRGGRVAGVIICRHSWSEPECEAIVCALASQYPGLAVAIRCPGCTEHDEAPQQRGSLCEPESLLQSLSGIGSV